MVRRNSPNAKPSRNGKHRVDDDGVSLGRPAEEEAHEAAFCKAMGIEVEPLPEPAPRKKQKADDKIVLAQFVDPDEFNPGPRLRNKRGPRYRVCGLLEGWVVD